MTLTVAPTVARGNAHLLQPFYYTSSLFVEPMKEDMSNLLSAFATAYSSEPLEPAKPFQLFKNVWHSEGWDLIHLKVLDARARETFLRTVIRLFIDRLCTAEHSLMRIGALFGLYTFYTLQMESSVGRNHWQALGYITITIDNYEQLLALPGTMQSSLRFYATYITSRLVSLKAFHIVPHSSFMAQNPRNLPHSFPILTRDIDYGHRKKTGRPSQLAQSQRADEALSALEQFIEKLGPSGEQTSTKSSPLPERPTPVDYVGLKGQLLGAVSSEAIKAAEARTMERIRDAERHVAEQNLPVGDREGLERLKDPSAQRDGLLGLVHFDDKK